MATSQEAINRLTIQSTLTGEAEVTAGLKRISAAHDGVAVSSSTNEKATISLEKSFANIERRYVAGVAAQQQYEKIQRQVNAAVAQNPALQDRANVVLAEAAKRHDALTGSQKAMAVAANDLNSRIQANAGSFGVLGQALSALGPVGVGVAATIGVVIGTLYAASSAAHDLAQKAKEIREFSEATGLTTTQFQALRSEAGKFGIDSETLSHGLSKFTAGYDELRKGGGALLTDIRKINPALAEQMQTATDSATAFTLFGKAVQQTSNVFERNALLKAGLGKGSAVFGAFFESAPDVAKLTDAFAVAGKGLDEHLIKKLAQLQVDIDRTHRAATNIFASMFAESTLKSELEFAKGLLTIAAYAKEFKFSSDLQKFIDFMTNPATLGVLAALATVGAVSAGLTVGGAALAVGAAGLVAGGAVGSVRGVGANAIAAAGSPANFVSPANSYSAFQAGATPVPAKTPEANAAAWKDYISILGSAATPTEKLNAAIAELSIKAKEAGREGEDLARGIAALKFDDAIARQSAHNAALGGAASITDIVNERMMVLAKTRLADKTITDQQAETIRRVTTAQADGTAQIQAQISAEKVRGATLFMSTEAGLAYAIAQTEINRQLAAGRPLYEINVAGIKATAAELAKLTVATNRTDDLMKLAQQSGTSFTDDLIKGLASGQTATESLHNAFKNLASTLTSSALKSLFEGDFISAGIKGIAAIGAAIFSANTSSSGDKWLKEQTANMQQRAADYSNRLAMVGVDTNTRAGAILAQDAEFVQQRIAENKSGGQQMNQLLQLQVQERNQLLRDWDQKDIDLVKANADAKLAIEKAAADRSLGFQNRLFAATNDFATLEGQLAAFDRAALQDRAAEVAAGGQAIVDLEAAQAAERLNVIKTYNDKITEAAEQAAKAQLDAVNGVGRNLTDFLHGLTSGPASTFSPQATLTNARLAYNANIPLAVSGNLDAQNKFVSLADDLLKASRAVNASSQAYQDDLNQVLSQGLALPAVQTATDPVVVEMRNVLAAINAGNATQALDATLQGAIKSAIDAGNAQAVAALLVPKFDTLNATTGTGLTFADFVAGLGPSYSNVAKNTTVAGLLTDAQLNAHGLLTDAQLRSAALSVSGPLTGTDLVNAHLLTDAQLRAAGLSVTGPVTDAQLRAAGLLVSGPLTESQIRGLGLSLEQGNVLNVFRELDGNGNGILEKSEVIKNASTAQANLLGTTNYLATSTRDSINVTAEQVYQNNALTSTANSLVTASNNFLTAINTFADRIIQAINAQGAMQSAIGYETTLRLALLLNWQPKLVYGGQGEKAATGSESGASIPYSAHALGGVIPAHGLGLVSEHSPGGGHFLRAGNEPITVSPFPAQSPFRAGNDNGSTEALRSEIAALRAEVAAFRKENGVNTMNAARHVGEKAAETTKAVSDGMSQVAYETRQAASK